MRVRSPPHQVQDPTNAESYAGSRSGSVVPWAIECEIRDLVRDPEFHVRVRVGDRMSCGIRVPIRD